MQTVDYTNLFRDQKFGKLTPICFHASSPRGVMWRFKCECGNDFSRTAAAVLAGRAKSCGCGSASIGLNLIGRRFGLLTVVSESDCRKHNFRHWECECDCGNSCVRSSSSLVREEGKVNFSSCGCLGRGAKSWNFNGFQEISGTYWSMVRKSARSGRSRIIPFDITIEEVWDLFVAQGRRCALSNIPLCFRFNSDEEKGTASLDRIDSSLGYFSGNVQWVHKDINKMKWDSSDADFIKWCRLIADRSG